ncbi:MAG: bifunctional demethylmenaquinone methyltransferase/2-methoxy-6-polyprenyl-1,4-benzoquinol methylase UbiE [Rickettsiales bacterium]
MAGSADFGYRKVAEDEKHHLVKGVFDSVATKYDLMNDLMSSGLHRIWKNEMVRLLNPQDGMKILDMAGGTGDISFRILQKADCNITICDINEKMLGEGKKRAIDRNIYKNIDWLCADAENLPIEDNVYDAYTIAFGIRNVTHIDKALSEAYRALKIGGRFLCLEFSELQGDILQKIYDFYSFNIIPKIGEVVTGDRQGYEYLVESIRMFPKQEEFKEMIEQAGFANVKYHNLSQGIVAIHSGWKV